MSRSQPSSPRTFACLAAVVGACASGTARGASGAATSQPTTRPAAVHADRRVCYVLSCGGSMITSFAMGLNEIRAGVRSLRPDQLIGVYAASDDRVARPKLGGGHPVPATDRAKDQVLEFASAQIPAGPTSVAAGLRAALSDHPDVLWLIADGADTKDDDPACLQVARQMNAGQRTKINTLLKFASSDAARLFLYDVARANGGDCLDAEGKPLAAPPPPEPPPPPLPKRRPRPKRNTP